MNLFIHGSGTVVHTALPKKAPGITNRVRFYPTIFLQLFIVLLFTGLHQNIFAQLNTSIDLSTYVRIGRFDLPEPTRTVAPPNSLLAQEASGVAYNWDTHTLFVVGDGGTSVVQVSKTGALINSMTLAPGGSPQGTEFYDPEGITYVGSGKFVLIEERDRQAVLFTYVAGGILTRADAQTVKLGTFAPNIGIEGISYDPLTSGFICVKEIDPQGIFQTGIDFVNGTATNGSPTTENSVNLFDPILTGLSDFADVFALSNIPGLAGLSNYGNLLVLSQQDGKIVNIDRSGNISSSLTIISDPGNPLSVPDQQHEGLTMDENGILYVVSENGGGDFDHPQLWVYAPSGVANQPPTAIALQNAVTSLLENTSTLSHVKVADILVTDDGLGTNTVSISGPDATNFEIVGSQLFIKAGTVLDFETRAVYNITVSADDVTVGSTPDVSTSYTLNLVDVVNESTPSANVAITEVAPWASGNSPVGADWFEVTNNSNTALDITGWKMDDVSNSFSSSVALNGITSIAPGESVIFIETATPATTIPIFLGTWFGNNPPAGLQVGSYTGSGVGLSTGGDGVSLFNAAGLLQAKVTFGASPAGPSFPTFDNGAGQDNIAITNLSATGINGAFVAVNDATEIGSPGSIGKLIISEVAAWSSGNSPVGADWFEVTNLRAAPVTITGWKMDDNSFSFGSSVALNGITTIAPGESVIFLETATPATTIPLFLSTWFGANPPAGLQVGSYSGSGVGLSTGADGVALFDAGGRLQAKVSFGASPAGPSFPTFDNKAGLNNTTISQLSVVGVNGAFAAVNDANEIGSPGVLGNIFISEVAPWSSGNSPVGADWFEITNTKATPVNITGWKMDDNSGSAAASVALNGITTIAPGESVIFLETATPATTIPLFLSTWFGANPPAGLQVGSYTGSGVGLSTGSDEVNIYNSANQLQARVVFGASSAAAPFKTFDNAAALNNTNISQLSAVGVNGAFIAFNDTGEIGSPGTTVNSPCPVLTVTAAANEAIACNGGTTTITVTATGGTAPYTGTGTFTVNAGTYTYSVTDSHGCGGTTTITVTEPEVLTVAASAPEIGIACNGGTATVTVTATGGTAPYTGTGEFVVGAGTFFYLVTDAHGCTGTAVITLAEPEALTVAASTPATGIACKGGTTTVTVAATGGTAPYAGAGTFTVGAGTYTYTITDAHGCTATATITVTEPAILTASSSAPAIICGSNSTTVTVTATGGTAPYTGTGTFPKQAGTWNFTVTDAHGCTATTSVTIAAGGESPCTPKVLLATKTYNPDNNINDHVVLCAPATYRVPELILVTQGNAGNHYAKLKYKTPTNQEITLLYRGASTQANPTNIIQVILGRLWLFKGAYLNYNQSTPPNQTPLNLHPGDNFVATEVTLEVDGSPVYGTTKGGVILINWNCQNTRSPSGEPVITSVPPLTNHEPLVVITEKESLKKVDQSTDFKVDVLPNPSSTYFTLVVKTKDYLTPVTIKVLDMNGKAMSSLQSAPNSSIRVGDDRWSAGIYLAEVVQGTERQVVRLVKVK